MRILRLEASGFSGIESAAVELGPGLNVLHGPNELGKSTLVDAVRAALLLQHTSSAGTDLLDWHAALPATVSLTFEEQKGRVWRVRKSFGRSPAASLELSRDGTTFHPKAKGREADGVLRGLLRWGIREPGGKGGGPGMPSSLIATALLGDQSDVEAILRASLAGDKDVSGRERLTQALQVLAEDPRFRHVVNAVQAKVDQAFTPGGKPKKGANSPWTALAAERLLAERERDRLRKLADDGRQTRGRIEALNRQLVEARSEARELERAGEIAGRRAAADKALSHAQAELDRIDRLLAELGHSEAALAAAGDLAERLAAECSELEDGVATLRPTAEEARERLRALESGSGEGQRALRRKDAENRKLQLAQRLADHDRLESTARGLDNAVRRADDLEAAIEGNRVTLRNESAALDRERTELDALRRLRQAARFRAARRTQNARTEERDDIKAHAGRADELAAEAAGARARAAALDAPDADEIMRLRETDTARRIAEESLDVGFVAEVSLDAGADAEVDVDGTAARRRFEAGRTVGLEARRELSLGIPGVGTLRVSGGRPDQRDAARSARQRWESASAPVFDRTGCGTLDELDDLRARSDRILDEARRLESAAAAEQAAGSGLDQAEQRLAEAAAEARRQHHALSDLLAGEAVADFLARFDDADHGQADDDGIAERETAAAGRRSRIADIEGRIAADVPRLDDARDHVAARESEFAGVAADGDWRRFLAGAAEQRARLEEQAAEVEAELAAISGEATSELGEARQRAESLSRQLDRAERELSDRRGERDEAGKESARLDGAARELRKQAQNENRDEAADARDAARATADALPPTNGTFDAQRLEEATERIALLESELGKTEGALEQMGGRHLDERAEQAEEGLAALDLRERELEIDYGGWRLLREALAEAEKDNVSHLGNALVDPVGRRMRVLTGGRYGDPSIGPELDPAGIALGGEDRDFASLSVGTREQIALLFRLSIAETLETFIFLDDQLTQSDRDRMAAMRDMLAAAAERIQVIVLTCHPDDYEAAEPHRMVDLSTCVARSLPTVGGGT